MENFKILTNLFVNKQEMRVPKEHRDSKAYTVFGGMAMLLIMIPCCIIVGMVAYVMTEALIEAGGCEQGILFIVHFMSACSLILGLNVMINVLYFSADVEYLLPLPIRPIELVASKFVSAYLSESIMEFMILISGFIGFLLASGFGIVKILAVLIGTLTLPIIPLGYCGIAGMIIIYVFRGIKSRTHMNRIVAILTILMIVFILLSFGGLKGLNVTNYITSLAANDNSFIASMNILFFHNKLLVDALHDGSIIELLIYLLANVVVIAIFLFTADKIYLKGLYRIKSVGNKATESTMAYLEKKSKQVNVKLTYFKKELKILWRNQAFFMNCVIINALWPIIMILVVVFGQNSSFIKGLMDLYNKGYLIVHIGVMVAVLAAAILITGVNSIASSAFTREGAHLEFMKYIPLSYKTQINIKALLSIVFSYASVFISVICVCIVIKTDVFLTIYFVLLSLLGVVFITYLGIMLDSMHPKLLWDDELSALRGNLNVFFNMAFAILAGIVLILIGCGLYFVRDFWKTEIYSIYFIFMVFIDIFMYRVSINKSVNNLRLLLNN